MLSPMSEITATQSLDARFIGDAFGAGLSDACGHGCSSANSHRYRSDEMAESFASFRSWRGFAIGRQIAP